MAGHAAKETLMKLRWILSAGAAGALVLGVTGYGTGTGAPLAGSSKSTVVPPGSFVGTAGADALLGTTRNENLAGMAGPDSIRGGAGNDVIRGGPGDDRVRGGGDPDTLEGGAGTDRIDGGGDADICSDADQIGPFIRCEPPPTTTTTSTTTSSTTSSTIWI